MYSLLEALAGNATVTSLQMNLELAPLIDWRRIREGIDNAKTLKFVRFVGLPKALTSEVEKILFGLRIPYECHPGKKRNQERETENERKNEAEGKKGTLILGRGLEEMNRIRQSKPEERGKANEEKERKKEPTKKKKKRKKEKRGGS